MATAYHLGDDASTSTATTSCDCSPAADAAPALQAEGGARRRGLGAFGEGCPLWLRGTRPWPVPAIKPPTTAAHSAVFIKRHTEAALRENTLPNQLTVVRFVLSAAHTPPSARGHKEPLGTLVAGGFCFEPQLPSQRRSSATALNRATAIVMSSGV
jgi:hypothetical protein